MACRLIGAPLWFLCVLVISSTSLWASDEQTCAGIAPGGHLIHAFSGTVSRGEPFRDDDGLGLAHVTLEPRPHGWHIALYGPHGEPLPVFAPPQRPVETNPLNLAGWHFRNAANDGPNTGDVNAPQHRRRFAFGALAVGAAHPETMTPAQPGQAPSGDIGGLGEIVLGPFELSPPAPGERASFEWLNFKGCLAFRQGAAEPVSPSPDAEPMSLMQAASALKACGLDQSTYQISGRMAGGPFGGQPGVLRPDMDGDGSPDLLAAIERREDKRPGAALCLSDASRLLLAGYDGPIGPQLMPDYFKSIDVWAVFPQGPIAPGASGAVPPTLRGDAVLLGKSETSSVLLFLTPDGRLDSYWQGD